MPCTVLIRATDSPSGGMLKGWPSVVRDEPWSWGLLEGLPDWIRVTLSDADASEVENYLDAWEVDFEFSIVSVTVDPVYISATNVANNVLKSRMNDWVTESYDERGAGGTVFSFSSTELVADVPKTGAGAAADLAKRQELKSRFSDKFKGVFSRKRWRFLATDVDAVVAAGGTVTRTKAQVTAIIRDRLTE